MKRAPTNISASIHQRLLNLARNSNRPFNELLQYFAIERFLYRFSLSPYKEQFVLKGAQMLRAWEAPLARPTMDVDMLGRQTAYTIENLEGIVRECCEVEVSDGVLFDTSSVRGEAINKDAEYQGVRVRVQGRLSKIKLNVQIDFGFGDVVVPKPVPTELPQLLDLGAPRLLGYMPESAIAEKFQAMVALDLANTRKDFYDIWSLGRVREFDGETLTEAIAATFKRRATPLPEGAPLALTDAFSEDPTKQALWQAFLRKGRLDAEGKNLTEVVGGIRDFLLPPVHALIVGRKFRRVWKDRKWREMS